MRIVHHYYRCVAVLIIMLIGSELTAQVSDACAGAIVITCGGTATGTTVGSTADVLAGACPSNASPGVWYQFTGTGVPTVVSLCGSAYDTRLSVLSGTCGAFVCEATNDDFCGFQSEVTVNTILGTTYYVLVYGYAAGSSGAFTLSVTCITPLANDNCSGALPIICGQTITGNTTGATTDVIPAGCYVTNTGPGIWYTFMGDGQIMVASLCGSAYDTQISVFTGSCGAFVCQATSDDFCLAQSQVSVNTVVGTTYYIYVFGFGAAAGSFSLNVTCVVPPPNDLCSGAIPVICGSNVTGNTLGASMDILPAGCYTTNTAPGVWYSFVGNGQILVASLCASAYDTQVNIFTGTCGALVCAGFNDDGCGAQSQASIPTVNGVTYYIYVSGFGASAGSFTLDISCAIPPPNDLCSGAIPIACGATVAGNTAAASTDVIPAGCFVSNTTPGVWYSFTGNGYLMTVSLCGSTYDTQVSLFSGTCGSLTCVTYNDDYITCGVQSQQTIATLNGVTYYVYVHGDGGSGSFSLALTCPTPPPAPCVSTDPNGCPDIDLGADISLPTCTTPCSPIAVTADPFQTGTTTSYNACSIPYAPYPYNTGTGFSIGIDDRWTGVINLPFGFCFFGTNYTQCIVGSNGVISFNTGAAGGFCPWMFNATCPNAALPLNSIFGVYHDIDPSIFCGATLCGDARYATFGIAPCRVFVVSWDNLPHFSFNCNALRTTCEIVLYETTNVIEVFVENKPVCYTWNGGNSLIGIQNATGTVGFSPSGRNTGIWNASYEGWRFTPNGPSNTLVQWYQQGSPAVIGTGNTINVCPTAASQTYLATATYTRCDGSQIVVNDDIIVQCAMFMVPVEWLSFDVLQSADASFVDCNWSTASEHNNDFFTIERSIDGEHWTPIGRIDGQIESSSIREYNFRDLNPVHGVSYYRISQTDLNGDKEYSEIRSVRISTSGQINIYPNPASEIVQVSPWKTTFKPRIFDSTGREIVCNVSDNGQIDVSQIQKGIYHLEIRDIITDESFQYNIQIQR